MSGDHIRRSIENVKQYLSKHPDEARVGGPGLRQALRRRVWRDPVPLDTRHPAEGEVWL
jgi:hypothetical protein